MEVLYTCKGMVSPSSSSYQTLINGEHVYVAVHASHAHFGSAVSALFVLPT